MSADDVPGLTEAEQKYFDSKGAENAPPETPEEKAAPEPPPESKAPEKPSGEPEKAKEAEDPAGTVKMAPLAAVHEERNRRKEYQKENSTLKERLARLEGELSAIRKPPEEQRPLDPIQQPLETIVDNNKYIAELRQREQQQAAFRDFSDQYAFQAREFSKTATDFPEAYNYLLQHRAEELRAAYGLDGIALEKALTSNEYEITRGAMERGQNPAQVLYGLAKMRGYTPKSAATTETKTDPSPEVKSAEALTKAAAQLETIAKGQEKSKSLSATGGAGNDGLPSTEELVAMDMDEFDKLTKNPRAWKRIAGG